MTVTAEAASERATHLAFGPLTGPRPTRDVDTRLDFEYSIFRPTGHRRLWVWAAPGGRETFKNIGGETPDLFAKFPGRPGPPKTPSPNRRPPVCQKIIYHKCKCVKRTNGLMKKRPSWSRAKKKGAVRKKARPDSIRTNITHESHEVSHSGVRARGKHAKRRMSSKRRHDWQKKRPSWSRAKKKEPC